MTTAAQLLPRLVGRVDDLEAKAIDQTGRLDGMDETLTDLAARLDTVEGTQRSRKPIDWLTVTDPALTLDVLTGLIDWHDTVLVWLNAPIKYPCWPWHPLVVAETLALRDYHTLAYLGGPALVVDLYQTRLTGYRARVGKSDSDARGNCSSTIHYLPGNPASTPYVAERALLPEYATWWATSRQGLPPGLTPATV